MSLTDKRIRFLKRMNMAHPIHKDADRENHAAVLLAYQSGALKLEDNKGSQVALFWGGKMIRGWGGLDSNFQQTVLDLKKELPDGKLWVEDVSFRTRTRSIGLLTWNASIFQGAIRGYYHLQY